MSTPIDSPSAAGHSAAVPAMGLVLDAQALYAELRRGVSVKQAWEKYGSL